MRPNFELIRDSTKVVIGAEINKLKYSNNKNNNLKSPPIIMLASVSGRPIPWRGTPPRGAACAVSSLAMTLLAGGRGRGRGHRKDNSSSSRTPTVTGTAPPRVGRRSHYHYAGPGRFSPEASRERHVKRLTQQNSWYDRGFTVGIGGPGKVLILLVVPCLFYERVHCIIVY